jgi:type I restriction enzyme S subunit
MATSEIKYTQIIEKLRLDAEYYQPEFLNTERLLKKSKSLSLDKLAELSKLRGNPTRNPERNFQYIDISNIDISSGDIQVQMVKGYDAPSRARKIVKTDDIIISTVRPNRNAVAIIPKELDNQVCSTGFAVIKPKKINPWVLFAYLKTRYAINQLVRATMASMYPAVSEEDIGAILIPVIPESLQGKIAGYVKEAYEKWQEAERKYKEAEKLLNNTLLTEKIHFEEKRIFETKFEEIECSRRFDTDYYLPNFTGIVEILERSKFELKRLKKISKEVIRKVNPLKSPEKEFTYVEIGDVDVSTGEIETKKILGYEAPPNARKLLKKADLVILMVRPTRGAITIIPDDLDGSLASSAFYILDASSPLKEFLLVYLRSALGLNQLGRSVVGAMYPTLKKEYIDEILIPRIPEEKQNQISGLIKEVFMLRKEARVLLEKAKREIENFIEGVPR